MKSDHPIEEERSLRISTFISWGTIAIHLQAVRHVVALTTNLFPDLAADPFLVVRDGKGIATLLLLVSQWIPASFLGLLPNSFPKPRGGWSYATKNLVQPYHCLFPTTIFKVLILHPAVGTIALLESTSIVNGALGFSCDGWLRLIFFLRHFGKILKFALNE